MMLVSDQAHCTCPVGPAAVFIQNCDEVTFIFPQVDMKSDSTVVWNPGNAAPILYGSGPAPPPPLMTGSNPGPPPPPPLADPLSGVPVPGGGPR